MGKKNKRDRDANRQRGGTSVTTPALPVAGSNSSGSKSSGVMKSFSELAVALDPKRDDHHDRANAIQIQKAIRNEYPVTDEHRKIIVTEAMEELQTTPKPRNKIAFMKVVLTADKLNVDRERANTPQVVDVNHSGGIGITDTRQKMLQEPGYLAYLEQQAADEDAIEVTGKNVPCDDVSDAAKAAARLMSPP